MRARLGLGTALGVLAQVASLGLLLTSGWLVVRASEQPPVLYLLVAITSVRMFGVARAVLRYAERLLTHDAVLARGVAQRVEAYEALARTMPAAAALRRGEVVRTVVSDVETVQDGLLRLRLPWVNALVTTAVAAVAVALVLPTAGAALALGAACTLVLLRLVVPVLARQDDRAAARRDSLAADVTELALAAPDLLAYGSARGRDAAAHEAVDALARADRRRAAAGGVGSLLVMVVGAATVLAVALATADAGLTGPLVGVLLLAPVGVLDVLEAVAEAERLRPPVAAAQRRLTRLVAAQDPMPPGDPDLAPRGFALELDAVTLGWDRDLVRDLSVRVEEGEVVVVTGPSGVGKSTLAATLSRLVPPRSGRVLLGGADLRDLSREQVRRVVGWMQQDAVLFDTTVRENLRVARPESTEADLWRALERVRLDGTVASWPDGLDTRLGEGAGVLSGGERQRLALARMLVAGHRVLVLDEPTEHLDAATARVLLDDVDALAGDHTVLVVSHAPDVVARYRRRIDLAPASAPRPRVDA